ncbi:MAG: hypothetical protein IT372_32500, partial [Polyangiaceae bacterium]|nr:hypothetical protein [Polyangiaceae bacterium]
MSPRVSLLALAIGAAAACAGKPAPAPRPQARPVEHAPPAPVAVALAAARWIDGGGATLIGPAVDGGTLVLLGGRRALVAADGAVRLETAPLPEPLLELVEVPTAGGARRLVGRGALGVYRLDDPLGAPRPLARSASELVRLGAAPGLVAIWDVTSDLPRFLDIESGQLRPMQTLPAPPLRAIAFRDAREGAAIFEAAGLAVTADGGGTWRLAGEVAAGDALRVAGLRLRRGELRAFAYADGRDAPVDVTAARLGPTDEAPAPAVEAPLLRWIRATGRDPLEAAIAGGALAAPGVALAASHGLVARIDVQTGVVLEIAEFARGGGVNACAVGGTEHAAWIACALSEDAGQDLYDPFGVLRVPLGGARLDPERPSLLRNGEAELRTSPSGGAMLLGACDADEEGVACARQPAGKWATLRSDADLAERGAGPLADGRVAMLRGLFDGDEIEPAASPDDAEEGDDVPAQGARRPRVVYLDEGGKERRGATLDWPGVEGATLRVVSPIEEAEDHALSFVVADDEGLTAVVVPPGREPAAARRLAGASEARVHAGHGVAVGGGLVLASRDAGLTWASAGAPPRVLEAIDHLGTIVEEPGVLAVNAVGVKIDTQLRIGWGAPEPSPDPSSAPNPADPPGALLPPRAPAAPRGPEQALACASQ